MPLRFLQSTPGQGHNGSFIDDGGASFIQSYWPTQGFYDLQLGQIA